MNRTPPTTLRCIALVLAAIVVASPAAAAARPVRSAGAAITGSLGVVTIYPNGTVSNPSAPIARAGAMYRLTGELNGSLVVLANGVVINGSGERVNYTVGEHGGDGAAVTLTNTSGVTIEDLGFANASIGILVENASTISISEDTISGSIYGIFANDSSDLSVSQNQFVNCPGTGVYVGGNSSAATVSQNLVTGSANPVHVQYSSDTTVAQNTFNATQMTDVYVIHSTDTRISANSAPSTVAFTSGVFGEFDVGVTANGNQFNGVGDGVELDYSYDLDVFGNNASNSESGVGAYDSQNGLFQNNSAFNSTRGAWAQSCTNVTFEDNWLPYDLYALYDYFDSYYDASGNYAPESLIYGIFSYASDLSTFSDNNLSHALGTGAYLERDTAVNVSGNNLSAAAGNAVEATTEYGPTTIWGNNLSRPNVSASADGVDLSTDYETTIVGDNQLANLDFGVYADTIYGPLVIEGNTVEDAATAGVYVEYAYANVSVTDNAINGSGTFGIYNAFQYGDSGLTVAHNTLDDDGAFGVYDFEDSVSAASFTVVQNQIEKVGATAIFADGLEGPATILDNDLANLISNGIDLDYDPLQPTTIAANTISNLGGLGILVVDGDNVSVSGNTVSNSSSGGVYLDSDNGVDQITDNDFADLEGVAIHDYDDVESVVISDNDASDTVGDALELYYDNSGSAVQAVGNDLANSGGVSVTMCQVSEFAANDLLNVSSINFSYDIVGPFFHNSVNSSAFVQAGNDVEGAGWNDVYPIGGNYWTGYTGTDHYSGPDQNLPGADGIGDTPFEVDNATDQYPLMSPWRSASINFTESGLPAGSVWSVTLNEVRETGLAGATISFLQVNGADTPFDYGIASLDPDYAAPVPGGSGTENGADQAIAVTFDPVVFPVTFSEKSLPADTAWSVTFDGQTEMSKTASIEFNATNGTHGFSISAPPGYAASPASGTLTVTGAAYPEAIGFAGIVASVEFVETGLPSGSSWSVSISGGASSSSAGTSLSLSLASGTYTFSVSVPKGWDVTPATGALTLSGSNETVYVIAYASGSAPGGTTSGSSSVLSTPAGWGLLAALILAILAAIVGWALYARRPKAGVGGPTPWTPPPSAGSPPTGAGDPPAGALGGVGPAGPPDGGPGGRPPSG